MRALLLSLLVACGGGAKQPVEKPEPPKDPIPVTAGPDCKTAVAQAITTVDDLPDADLKAKVAAILEVRCTEDKWSDEARSCFATAQTDEETQGCADNKLTEGQRAAVKAKVEKEMEGSGMAKKKEAVEGMPKEDKKSKGTTRGATKKPKGSDPCQGGESDPCQGGQ